MASVIDSWSSANRECRRHAHVDLNPLGLCLRPQAVNGRPGQRRQGIPAKGVLLLSALQLLRLEQAIDEALQAIGFRADGRVVPMRRIVWRQAAARQSRSMSRRMLVSGLLNSCVTPATKVDCSRASAISRRTIHAVITRPVASTTIGRSTRP